MIKLAAPPSWLQKYTRGHLRAFKEGVSMPWEHPLKSIMTIITLAICFYIPLTLWTVWLNYEDLKSNWKQQGSIAIFLQNSAETQEAGVFVQELLELDWVESVRVMNKSEIQQELKSDEQISQVMELVQLQELPDQVLIHPNPSVDQQSIRTFVNELTVNPQVSYISYDEKWFNQLHAVTSTFLQLARLSALIFLAIVMVFLGHIIGNEISQHKRELLLLELIGASWAQMRRRFLYFGCFFGGLAGILALIMLVTSLWWLQEPLNDLAQTYATELQLSTPNSQQMILILILCIAITWIAARISLSAQNQTIE